jgi:hypothetical protein
MKKNMDEKAVHKKNSIKNFPCSTNLQDSYRKCTIFILSVKIAYFLLKAQT